MIQTIVAAVVVFSYYTEYRANLKYTIQQGKASRLAQIEGYGHNKGSQGYGNRQSQKMTVKKMSVGGFSIKRLSKQSMVGKLVYIVWKEAMHFLKALYYDRGHFRNVGYLWLSIIASYQALFNALLLMDIVNKIKTLS